MHEPTAIPKAITGLSTIHIRIADTCSHAFPTIGRSITPIKVGDMSHFSIIPSIELTKHSDDIATNIVEIANRDIDHEDQKYVSRHFDFRLNGNLSGLDNQDDIDNYSINQDCPNARN